MRSISFMHTTEQIRSRTKTVTRRLGWATLKPGTLLRAVRQAMGLKKGEAVQTLAILRVVSVRREPLSAITDEDVAREGYPGWSREEFVGHFTSAMRCDPSTIVTRIEFEYVDESQAAR